MELLSLLTHFYLPTLNLELPKQIISPSFCSKPMFFCWLPKHCKPLQSCAFQASSLADNIRSPLPPRNHLLSFPSHRLSSSPLLPWTISTRSHFSDPNSSTCPLEALLPGIRREPLASILQCAALLPACFIKPQALQILCSPW